MDAQGALNSLLGRLTAVLVNEAQLLGGVRGDVEFIKDEMESMNGLLLHLSEAQHRDHQVQAWMKQVVSLTRDCGGNVELYVHYGGGSRPAGGQGLLGYLLRIPRLVRTLPVRRRIATRIRELKTRAREVGERRLRYGATVPDAQLDHYGPTCVDDRPTPQPRSPDEEEDLRKRELLESLPETVEEGAKQVLEWLLEDAERWPRAMAIEGPGRRVEPTAIARMVEILAQLVPTLAEPPEVSLSEIWDKLSLFDKVTALLTGKRFIIVLGNALSSGVVQTMIDGFCWQCDCNAGSALIATRNDDEHYPGLSGISKILDVSALYLECLDRRAFDVACYYGRHIVPKILKKCGYLDALAPHMFLRHLYASTNCSETQMLCRDLDNHISGGIQIMLRFCFKDLPAHYKSCLVYLSIFPEDQIIGRTCLLRRWVAEGLINERNTHRFKGNGRHGMTTLDDEAELIFDSLIIRGFLYPEETSAAGKIKTFTVPDFVHKFIVGDFSFSDTCLPPDLAYRLSINSTIELHEASCNNDRPFGGILTLLESITGSFQWQLLKVLDLQGCKGLKKKHMKNICKILLLLKFLSLRGTDVVELPKQIEKLQRLETLDIRQTMVQKLPTTFFMLQMLRHLLAGHKEPSDHNLQVHLPRGIQRMKKLQVLSCVEVSNNDDYLHDLGHLLQLRKLGVILQDEKGLSLLFQQIEKLHSCLRSLSIRINQPRVINTPDAQAASALVTPPRLLQSLKISGITNGLPLWIADLDQLQEITLSNTHLGEDATCILGNLRILRCLKLLQESYAECNLNFQAEEFQSLRSLVVVNSGITRISFNTGAAPNLKMVYWSSTATGVLSGVENLPKLNKLELNGATAT
ncbi:unnamed protein product [Urochloa decumbens]|uniref:Rx N-terminal domain-containing protein n=1 Tax=Urochloa decumbens TaxID=240449 RepID=A0ABC9B356_9POAL